MHGDETDEAPEAPETTTPDEPAVAEQLADTDAALTDELRASLASMREEADRIASMDTGTEQVQAAEQFAEDAGRLDEQVGSVARGVDDERG